MKRPVGNTRNEAELPFCIPWDPPASPWSSPTPDQLLQSTLLSREREGVQASSLHNQKVVLDLRFSVSPLGHL